MAKITQGESAWPLLRDVGQFWFKPFNLKEGSGWAGAARLLQGGKRSATSSLRRKTSSTESMRLVQIMLVLLI